MRNVSPAKLINQMPGTAGYHQLRQDVSCYAQAGKQFLQVRQPLLPQFPEPTALLALFQAPANHAPLTSPVSPAEFNATAHKPGTRVPVVVRRKCIYPAEKLTLVVPEPTAPSPARIYLGGRQPVILISRQLQKGVKVLEQAIVAAEAQ